jgi:hypothetical protein
MSAIAFEFHQSIDVCGLGIYNRTVLPSWFILKASDTQSKVVMRRSAGTSLVGN